MLCRKEDFVDKSLPFHLIVLEWALHTATQLIAKEAVTLERQAEAVIQKLMKQVCLCHLLSDRQSVILETMCW